MDFPVHPLAKYLPGVGGLSLSELVEDIGVHGLREPKIDSLAICGPIVHRALRIYDAHNREFGAFDKAIGAHRKPNRN
jgi:hypothetical protein